jgi:ABC-type nitrate/sulfonate/bicarbonate transport system ATPase subunit
MRKRLSFARCLGSGASIVLLDEPFASLDVKARSDMQRLVHETLSETRGLAILVTHDVDEAVFLASRIMICKGPPLEVIKDIELTFPLPRAESFRVTEDFEKVCAGVRALLNREKA